jgi:hypothetical protein
MQSAIPHGDGAITAAASLLGLNTRWRCAPSAQVAPHPWRATVLVL